MKEKLANPIAIRILLVSLSIFLIAIQAGAVVLGKQYLGNYATSVAEISAKSKDTQESLDSLARAERELEAQKDIVNKAKNIVAESKSYKYQNQVIGDLNSYAKQTGVVIKSFAFADPSVKADVKKSTAAIAGISSTPVIMQLESPIPYDILMRFIALIENNVTRMQITELAISAAEIKDAPAGQSWVSVPSLTVEVYLQK
jgi:cell division protein FtsB